MTLADEAEIRERLSRWWAGPEGLDSGLYHRTMALYAVDRALEAFWDPDTEGPCGTDVVSAESQEEP